MTFPKPKKVSISKLKRKVICQECGKEFTVARWRIGIAKYCSPPCSFKGRTTKKSYHNPRKCIGCGI